MFQSRKLRGTVKRLKTGTKKPGFGPMSNPPPQENRAATPKGKKG
jgi:hypothetical protein